MTEESLFDLALNTPEADRPAVLDRACAGDTALRARVEALLAADGGTQAHDAGGTRTFAADPDRTATLPPPAIGEAGQVVAGRYTLVEPVGEGGMGTVWRAKQTTPVTRYVAVKLIKAGMDSKAVLARFDAERQALALMDHPNIARIFDGGLHDGRPFFVMELVKGTPITEFCDARKLTPQQRLELFIPVCQAIQHAHMKGVIHRDIKPANVLVALYDDRPVQKVIDFGVAKATGGALTEQTIDTGFGGVVGTPQYMSPEQATFNNLDIDTRSDVYSLGVLLYELLAGSPPFARAELRKAGILEILRVVREEEPPRPSVKLSTADARPSISANRGTEPGRLTGLLRSELDWIVMRALEKDRARRYDTANGFAADVRRYLAGEAVQAHPPSRGYRLRKWTRKNRGLVLTTAVVAATLLAGMATTTWQAVRAERETARAKAEEAKVRDEQANTQAARDAAELNLVHSYLRPIGYNTRQLDQAELVALDELSRQPDDRIKLLFLREACRDGDTALRVARRAERVIQAAVGPSLKRRAEVLAWTSATQRDPAADPRVRLCACWFAIHLGSNDLPGLGEAFDTLAMRKVGGGDDFIERLAAVIRSEQLQVLWNGMVVVLCKCNETSRSGALEAGRCLIALARKVDQATAERGFDALVGVLGSSNDEFTRSATILGLTALVPRINGKEAAARAFSVMVEVLSTADFDSGLSGAGLCLIALAPQLNAVDAARAFDALVGTLGTTHDGEALAAAGKGIAALAPRLDATAAARASNVLVALVSIRFWRSVWLGVALVVHVGGAFVGAEVGLGGG